MLSARYWSEAAKEKKDPPGLFYDWKGERPRHPNDMRTPAFIDGLVSSTLIVKTLHLEERKPMSEPLVPCASHWHGS